MPTTLYLIVSGPSSSPYYYSTDGLWTTSRDEPLCCFASLDEALTLCATEPNARPLPLTYTPSFTLQSKVGAA